MLDHDQATANIIATADGDTDVVITHNMALAAADLAAGRPIVTLMPGQAEAAASRLSAWVITNIAANTVTVTKTAAGGSGAAGIQLRVDIRRPHTIGR
jgi:hypothetical protein